jgi:hypothetical protein
LEALGIITGDIVYLWQNIRKWKEGKSWIVGADEESGG